MDKRKLLIGTLCALIMIMAVGYALLSQQLSINGSASITSNWQVEITNIRELEKSTGATTNSTNYTVTTASFNTSLTSPGDYALYEVTVTNSGTLDAVLSAKPTVTTGNNQAIQYELEGIKKGDKILKNNQTDTFTIKVQYNSSTTTQPNNLTSNIEVTLNYEQDFGQIIVYDEYFAGDMVTFAGEKWYVLENSSDAQDYIKLLKYIPLSIGDTYNYGYDENNQLFVNRYGIIRGIPERAVVYDGVQQWLGVVRYYTSETCGYLTSQNTASLTETGCTNNYDNSDIKKLLDNYASGKLGINNLKTVNNYKIRLLTKEDLADNLFYVNNKPTANTPEWLCDGNSLWTMSPVEGTNNLVYYLYTRNELTPVPVHGEAYYSRYGNVMPVINLLKSAIVKNN